MNKIKKYLKKIDEVIEAGPFKDTWASLYDVVEPKWYKDAKFGIFIHWGPFSVPGFEGDWYSHYMYKQESDVYDFHVKTYGDPKEFGYKDLIPLFKAEKFDPKEWVQLFEDAGAKFVMPVAEHHDGFQMYDSDISQWNAVKMGPKRDLLGDLKKEIEAKGMVFTASSHRAENFWFMSGAMDFDSGLDYEGYVEPYGYRIQVDGTAGNPSPKPDYGDKVPVEHLEDWLVRTCEIIDLYQPKVIWFDWWIQNVAFKPYLRKLAAYYYNRGKQWGVDVAINYKDDAYVKETAIFDVERGQLNDINPRFWQTDTAVAKNSWVYTENNDYKKPEDLVCDLVDIVSKNGALLLNIGPKGDGTIPDEDRHVLLEIGKWLKANGDAIYGTTYWSVYGEGPTEIVEGTFQDVKRESYTTQDIRYTFRPPYIFATVLKWPKNNRVTLKSLAKGSQLFKGLIEDISLLAYDKNVTYIRDEDGLKLTIDSDIDTRYPVTFKIQID